MAPGETPGAVVVHRRGVELAVLPGVHLVDEGDPRPRETGASWSGGEILLGRALIEVLLHPGQVVVEGEAPRAGALGEECALLLGGIERELEGHRPGEHLTGV